VRAGGPFLFGLETWKQPIVFEAGLLFFRENKAFDGFAALDDLGVCRLRH